MERTNRIYVILGVIVILIGLGYFTFNNLESYEETIDLGMSLEARRNPQFAAKIFMQKSGILAESEPDFSLLENLPSPNDLIVITGSREALSEYKYKKLRQWVEQGGRLILTVQTLFDEERGRSGDSFLDRIGVRQYLTEDHKKNDHTKKRKRKRIENLESPLEKKSELDEEELEEIKEDLYDMIYNRRVLDCKETVAQEDLSKIYLPGIDRPLTIAFSTEFYMVDGNEKAAIAEGSRYGLHLLQYIFNKGWITVLTDSWIWDNENICRYDHAYLLWLLAKDAEKVWFLYQTDSPSLIKLIVKNNHILLISLILSIGLLALKKSFRFGPLILKQEFVRRKLKDHIDASGRYYWYHNQKNDLVDAVRSEILKKLNQNHAPYFQLTEQDRLAYLSNLSGIPQKEVFYVLNHSSIKKENEFTYIIKQAQKIMEHL